MRTLLLLLLLPTLASARPNIIIILAGDQVTFRYAFLFHRASGEEKPVDDLYKAWAGKRGC